MPASMSAYTSVNKDKVPALFSQAADKGVLKPGMSVLDFGCGRWPETVAEFLAERGIADLDQWDPNWFPDADYKPDSAYDAGCLSNVLNVIGAKREREAVLKTVWDALKPGGVMLVTVYEGDGSGASGPSREGCWQERRKLQSYVDGELAPYMGSVIPGTKVWASLPKPDGKARYYPPIGTKLTLRMPSGAAIPFTVVGKGGGKLRIRRARLIFDGIRYYDTIADRIEEGLPGDPEEELVWHPKLGDWHGKGKYGGYPAFGYWEHQPYLD